MQRGHLKWLSSTYRTQGVISIRIQIDTDKTHFIFLQMCTPECTRWSFQPMAAPRCAHGHVGWLSHASFPFRAGLRAVAGETHTHWHGICPDADGMLCCELVWVCLCIRMFMSVCVFVCTVCMCGLCYKCVCEVQLHTAVLRQSLSCKRTAVTVNKTSEDVVYMYTEQSGVLTV